jgi:hypothetical protein
MTSNTDAQATKANGRHDLKRVMMAPEFLAAHTQPTCRAQPESSDDRGEYRRTRFYPG